MARHSLGSCEQALVLGVDLGTAGARVLVVGATGQVLARGAAPIAGAGARGERHEQDPAAWWTATRAALEEALSQLGVEGRARLRALSVAGTSGTIVGLDARAEPVTPALMYNDARSTEQAVQLSRARRAPPITSSYSIAKIAWLARHEPEAFACTRVFAHQADFIATRLGVGPGLTDWSNALKSGYDIASRAWPAWLDVLPGLRDRLPRVLAPGAAFGPIDAALARELGLPEALTVVAGCTDGTAGFLASGAARIGDDNTTLGTTLVFKRIAERPPQDPRGALYSHALPGGLWLPGAASNVGADWIRQEFAGGDLAALDAAARERLPSPHLAYPSMTRGERFPFRSVDAEGFCDAPAGEGLARYAAMLQGTAFVERLGYELLDEACGSTAAGDVFSTGGGSGSDVWTQLRADVCGRTYRRPASAESAFGCAVLAALGAGLWPDLRTACGQMVRIERTFRPEAERTRALEPLYQSFLAELTRRTYLSSPTP